MCDIIVAMPDATEDGKILFGKNSDRPAGECQPLSFYQGGEKINDNKIKCTYLTIPQSSRVLSTIGCKPYWSWGYETGMNEAGVVGGNVAVFTRSMHLAKNRKRLGLNGMELLRIGLERGDSAEKAMDIIIQFLEKYGQWGSAVQGLGHEQGSYENSFLLVDKNECWVLETSGQKWVAECVKNGVRAISNQLSIENKWTKSTEGIIEFAHDNGWYDVEDNQFNFAYVYGDHEHYSRQVSHIRWKRSNQLLKDSMNMINKITMMSILRDHYENTFLDGPTFHQFLPDFQTLCMHDSPSKFTWGNTASSVVIEIDPDHNLPSPFWLCYLPPCCGIYLTFFLGYYIPECVLSAGKQGQKTRRPTEVPRDEYMNDSLWWRFQRLLEAVTLNPQVRYKEMRILLDPLEKKLFDTVTGTFLKKSKNEIEDFIRYEISQVLKKIKLIEKHWNIV